MTVFRAKKMRHQHVAHTRRRVAIETDPETFIEWWKSRARPFRAAVILDQDDSRIIIDLHVICKGGWAGDFTTVEKAFKTYSLHDHAYNLKNIERHVHCCPGDRTGDCKRNLTDDQVEALRFEVRDKLIAELRGQHGDPE